MKAYLDNPQLKNQFIAELEKHKKADSIMQGTYGKTDASGWKGCAVACSLRSLDIIDGKRLHNTYDSHTMYESRLGIPAAIAYIEDSIFEGLPQEKAMEWPLRFANAIQVGADLSLVTPKFLVWILNDVKQHAADSPKVLEAVNTVITLYERMITGGTVGNKEWVAAARAAGVAEAAEAAAWAAAGAAGAAEAAAWAAARAAGVAEAAAKAAEAAAGAAEAAEAAARAAGAAVGAVGARMANKFIEILETS